MLKVSFFTHRTVLRQMLCDCHLLLSVSTKTEFYIKSSKALHGTICLVLVPFVTAVAAVADLNIGGHSLIVRSLLPGIFDPRFTILNTITQPWPIIIQRIRIGYGSHSLTSADVGRVCSPRR